MSASLLLRILLALCSLSTAAHFLRVGSIWEALPALIPIGALLWPRLVPLPLLLLTAAAGCGLWAYQGITLALWRMNFGFPWLRLTAIIGTVSAAHALVGWLLASGPGTRVFGSLDKTAWARTVAFLLVGGTLVLATSKTSLQLMLGERLLPGSSLLWITLFALYANVITHHLLTEKHARTRSKIWLFFSAVFFGQLLLGLAGWSVYLMTGTLHLPVPALIVAGPLFRGSGLFMPILLGASLVLVGPAWCSYLCYIGAWDDRMARLGPRKPHSLPSWAPKLRGLILAATVTTPVILRLLNVPLLWAVGAGGIFGLCGVVIMLLWSRRSGTMTHCTVWCPIGMLNNILGRILPWRVRMDDRCTECGACAPACRYNALTLDDIRRRRPGFTCTLCGDCVSRCPHGHLFYAFPGLNPTVTRHIFVTLVVSLHTMFLAIARI